MSVRAIRCRVQCDRVVLEHLWRTHRVFNERLPRVLTWLFRMRRGECGETIEDRTFYQRLGTFITRCSAQNADYLMNAVSIRNWKPASAKKIKITAIDDRGEAVEITGESWADEAAARSAHGKVLFAKNDAYGDLPKCMTQMLQREAVAIVSGHDELVAAWNRDHKRWLDEKAKWERDPEHAPYLSLRPKFDQFETSVGGAITKRRARWHLYLDWMRKNPDLAAWRGSDPVVNDLPPDAQMRIIRAKPWKKRSVEAEEFWKANPELAALDRLHGHYEKEFVRRRKSKRNRDGFDHRPTFTTPHPVMHPRWFVFNAPQTNPSGYRNLRLPDSRTANGGVELQLLVGDKIGDSEFPVGWVPVTMRCDPRLALFRASKVSKTINRGHKKGQTKIRDAYEFYDPHLKRWRPAEISGVKLLFREIRLNPDGSLKSAVPYLVFACTTADLPLTDRARKITWLETGETTKSGKRRKSRSLPDGLVTCAIDLGLRNVGFATLSVFESGKIRVLRSRNIWLDRDGGGPDLAHIGRHKRDLKRLRRLRGKPVKGERSHAAFQEHITHMGEDRFKKAARGIINFAWNVDGACDKTTGNPWPRADVIVLEMLEGFIPDAARERGINRSLAAWNRGQLVAHLKQMAIDAGYKGRVFEVHPAGTSQVCCRCGAMGRRYSISRDNESRQADIRFGWVETLFACALCGYRANADHNASVNIQRKFVLGDDAVKAFFSWRNQEQQTRESDLERLDASLTVALCREHKIRSRALENPF